MSFCSAKTDYQLVLIIFDLTFFYKYRLEVMLNFAARMNIINAPTDVIYMINFTVGLVFGMVYIEQH